MRHEKLFPVGANEFYWILSLNNTSQLRRRLMVKSERNIWSK